MRLHLGCGNNIIPGWLNLDLEPGPGGIKADLTAPLAYRDNSVDFIFTEHFVEHITHEQGVRFFKECYRVLRSGGVLRISTPDLGKLISDYERGSVVCIPGVWEPKSPAVMVNEGMRLWGHQFVYDFDELIKVLGISGFRQQIQPMQWHRSMHPELKEAERRPDMRELIVEATK